MKILPKGKIVFFSILLILIIAICGCTGTDTKPGLTGNEILAGCDGFEKVYGNNNGVTQAVLCIPPQGTFLSKLVNFSGQGDSTKTSIVQLTCTLNGFPASVITKWKLNATINSCTDGCITKTDNAIICAEDLAAANG
jgi:hypothetical protein